MPLQKSAKRYVPARPGRRPCRGRRSRRVTEQPRSWPYSATGRTRPSVAQPSAGSKQALASIVFQPKFGPAGDPAGQRSISSDVPWPTSAIHRSPVARSNEKRHGLRSP